MARGGRRKAEFLQILLRTKEMFKKENIHVCVSVSVSVCVFVCLCVCQTSILTCKTGIQKNSHT